MGRCKPARIYLYTISKLLFILAFGCSEGYFANPPTPSIVWALVESRALCETELSIAITSPLVSERHREFFVDLCHNIDSIIGAVQYGVDIGINPEDSQDAWRGAEWAVEMVLRYNLWLYKFADGGVPCSTVLEACDWLGEYCLDNSGDIEELRRILRLSSSNK